MEVFYCNINKFNEEIEDFVIAKNKIESSLKFEGKIEKKMTVNEFMSYINKFQNSFLENSSKIIAFNIYDIINGDKVIIFSAMDDEFENLFKENLKTINYKLDQLKKVSYIELLQNPIDGPYFSIDNDIYIL